MERERLILLVLLSVVWDGTPGPSNIIHSTNQRQRSRQLGAVLVVLCSLFDPGFDLIMVDLGKRIAGIQ